ncbi:Tol-Pal system beta propeller repeat protein TolB [Oceanospirillum linum]|uniref:Tol-Pal system protein TolB n=1 Tax=Oceanospirillum linum TaxID=966 RepID=A0A1T1HCH4_OCELI|nr:Tol-Pal system beta propeller repeat protein TolB [Oceanospirillum linum]OOV87574.1 Tol-Pal system beta propeller repeat protein TolB [Oceanospirillum linum]SEF92217.1 TolB protein [Oleiphilus messinensis]SMP12778.1 TolB protein [Oceanospirillum linum]
MLLNKWLKAVAFTLLCVTQQAVADLTIEITQGNDRATPVAVVPFAWLGQSALAEDVAQIVSDDLERSGLIKPLSRSDMLSLPSQKSDIYFRDWSLLKQDYLLIGQVKPSVSPGMLTIQFELYDVVRQTRVLGEVISGKPSELRSRAHYISDKVFEHLTGIAGAFSTRLAYVTVRKDASGQNKYELKVSDADGRREKSILTTYKPILSPAWSPDAEHLAYVSYETGRPAVFIQNVYSGKRRQLTAFKGLNGAPTWSPDGNKLAVVLSKDGNPELYQIDLTNYKMKRITNHYAIDTEPEWSPDGSKLLFTSSRSGGPQIYQLDLVSGETERLTFEGNYNARARYAPDGTEIYFVHQKEGIFHIAAQELANNRLRILTQTPLDESPSVSPNGSMLIYATQEGSRGYLGAVSVNGQIRYRLPSQRADVREPTWSPFLTN